MRSLFTRRKGSLLTDPCIPQGEAHRQWPDGGFSPLPRRGRGRGEKKNGSRSRTTPGSISIRSVDE